MRSLLPHLSADDIDVLEMVGCRRNLPMVPATRTPPLRNCSEFF
jgi:hypothetical protein